jgi:hypothetical protein
VVKRGRARAREWTCKGLVRTSRVTDTQRTCATIQAMHLSLSLSLSFFVCILVPALALVSLCSCSAAHGIHLCSPPAPHDIHPPGADRLGWCTDQMASALLLLHVNGSHELIIESFLATMTFASLCGQLLGGFTMIQLTLFYFVVQLYRAGVLVFRIPFSGHEF